MSDNFRNLGSIIHKDGEIKDDVNHRIKIEWIKWRNALEVLCDRKSENCIRLLYKQLYYMAAKVALLRISLFMK